MMEPWVPGFITGSLALIGVLAAAWLQTRRERAAHARNSATPGAPTVQEIWIRQDKMERCFKSALVLLEEVAEQESVDPTQLSKKHLKVLADAGYLPAEWDYLVDN